MARTVRDAKLDSRAARERLGQGQRHWRALDPGLHIGYRKGATGGKWLARFYAGDGTYRIETIGVTDDKADADGVAVLSFPQAQVVTREKHIEYTRAAKGLPARAAGPYRVCDAIEEYLKYLEAERKSEKDARWRAEALILHRLGDIVCADLNPKVLRDWLHETAKARPRVRTKQGEAQRYRETDDESEQQRKRRAHGKSGSDDPQGRAEPSMA